MTFLSIFLEGSFLKRVLDFMLLFFKVGSCFWTKIEFLGKLVVGRVMGYARQDGQAV